MKKYLYPFLFHFQTLTYFRTIMNKNLTTDIVFFVEKIYLLMNIMYIETCFCPPFPKSILHLVFCEERNFNRGAL